MGLAKPCNKCTDHQLINGEIFVSKMFPDVAAIWFHQKYAESARTIFCLVDLA